MFLVETMRRVGEMTGKVGIYHSGGRYVGRGERQRRSGWKFCDKLNALFGLEYQGIVNPSI